MDRNTREWKRHGLVYDTPMGRAGRGLEIGAADSGMIHDSGIKMMRQSVGGSGAGQDEVSESRQMSGGEPEDHTFEMTSKSKTHEEV